MSVIVIYSNVEWKYSRPSWSIFRRSAEVRKASDGPALEPKKGMFCIQGCRNKGGWGRYIPPIIWLYPPNNLNGCTVHLSENWGKKCSISDEDLFFWSSPGFGEKSVLFLMETFFLHLNLGKKCSICIFLLFTKFPNLNKIVHLHQCWK